MQKLDLILDRIAQGICPICTKAIALEYKIVEDKKYGKVRICKNHTTMGDENEN
jgi:hypothetical protein